MGRTACTEPQCLYRGALYLFYVLLQCPKLRKRGVGNPWSYTTDCNLTECVILWKCGRKKFIDIRLCSCYEYGTHSTPDVNRFQKVRCLIMVCIMLRHLCAYGLLMDPKGSKFNTVQAGLGREGGELCGIWLRAEGKADSWGAIRLRAICMLIEVPLSRGMRLSPSANENNVFRQPGTRSRFHASRQIH